MDPNGSVLDTSVRPVRRTQVGILVPTLLLVLAAAGPATGQDWLEDAKLRARDAVTNDTFGWSVSVDDGRALIGVHPDRNPGAAYVFERVGNGWIEVATGRNCPVSARNRCPDCFGITAQSRSESVPSLARCRQPGQGYRNGGTQRDGKRPLG